MFQCATTLLAVTVTTPSADAALMVTNVAEDPGTIQGVPAIHPAMNGALMAGARVEVGSWGGGLTETVLWHATGANSGQAEGSVLGWRLSLTGDSSGNPLVLEGLGTNGIGYVTIDLLPHSMNPDMPDDLIAVFDDHEPHPGTPGSLGGSNPWNGLLAGSFSTLGWDIDVTYRNMVALGSNPPAKDIYAQLRIDFSEPFVGDDRMEYLADSDRVGLPEPASFALFGMGGILMACRGRRR